MIRVTVWNENRSEQLIPAMKEVYPDGLHGALAAFLGKEEDFEVRIATLDEPDCGLPDEVLNNTDVMLWWGHGAHWAVPDELARKVADRVLCGMGIIFLHSAHYSKPFKLLMGTSCSLRWREGILNGYGASIRAIPLPRAFPPISSWKRKKCTANSSIFPSRMSWSSAAGSAAASCSAPAAAGTAGWARYSTSSLGTRPTPPSITLMCSVC